MKEILSIFIDNKVDFVDLIREIVIINPSVVLEATRNLEINKSPWMMEALPFIKVGDRVSAIKICRKHTNATLFDAVNMVKEFMIKNGIDYNELFGE